MKAMLSLQEMKQIINGQMDSQPADDLRMLDSWAEYDEKSKSVNERPLKYLCYELEAINPETGESYHIFKALKFARVIRLPKAAKQSTSLMDMHTQILAGVYEQGYNMITLIANIIEPVPLGILFLYGIQGVGESIEEAKEQADQDFVGFLAMMQGTYRVLEMRIIREQETEWLREKMYNMDFLTVIRGIPKASKSGENAGNKGMSGNNLNPDSQGTLEEIISGMADYEYVIEVLSTPVPLETLKGWQLQTQRDMTAWYSQLQGSKSLSFNLSIPMMYMSNLSSSQGWSQAYTDANTVSYSQGESYSTGYGESVGESLSQSFGKSMGETVGTTVTDSTTQTHTISQGHSLGETFGTTFGQTTGTTQGLTSGTTEGSTTGTSTGQSYGQSTGQSLGSSVGSNTSQSQGVSTNNSISQGQSLNHSEGTNTGESISQSQGQSYNVSQGQNVSQSHNVGSSQNMGFGQSINVGQNNSSSVSNGVSSGTSNSTNMGWSQGNSSSSGSSSSTGSSGGSSVGNSSGTNNGNSYNQGGNSGGNVSPFGMGGSWGSNSSIGESSGTNSGVSNSNNWGWSNGNGSSTSNGTSSGTSGGMGMGSSSGTSSSHSQSAGNSISQGFNQSQSFGTNESFGVSTGQSLSQGWGVNENVGHTQNVGSSVSNGWGQNISQSQGTGTSTGNSVGQSVSQNVSQNLSQNNSQNLSQSNSQSNSNSFSQSNSVSQSNSLSQSQSQSYSKNDSESYGLSQGRSVGQSQSQSYSENYSQGTGQNWGQSKNVSQGQNYGESNGRSQGQSMGSTGAVASGMSSSMGLGPSIGYNKSYQWLDQGVKDILELLEYQNERTKKALRGAGAFYTYVYIACPSKDALSAAKAAAKAAWQNEYAMIQPVQALELSEMEQKHLLYHFAAFSADVTRQNVAGVQEYSYSTVLLPDEYVSYTHLPRISEGGVFAEINDVPKFAVPSMMKGEIFMGSILSPERYTALHGYETPYDYRISEGELMHGFFSGASRSGKTVTAMRFIAELAHIRRKKTGKRLRIVCMDPKKDWRTIARFVEPERFHFYSLGNVNFHPINLNPCKIPRGVWPQMWVDGLIDIYCRAYGLLERGKQMMGETMYALYEEAGVFEACDRPDWREIVPELSKQVTFPKVYKRMEQIKARLEDPTNPKGRAGNDTRDAYARLLDRLQAFNREFSIERRLFGQESGMGVDDLIGADDVTVLESEGLESTFANFIFGIITSGFYKFAKHQEHGNGYLSPEQYETVLVIEEANKVLTGNDTAGTGGGSNFGMSGQSEFEEILDQSAGYGLFVFAVTQKISEMPKSIIANAGLIFAGRQKIEEDVKVIIRSVAREERYEDRDMVKWFPRCPTGWFVCQSSRTFDFKESEPVLVHVAPLNINPPSNAELEEILTRRDVIKMELT